MRPLAARLVLIAVIAVAVVAAVVAGRTDRAEVTEAVTGRAVTGDAAERRPAAGVVATDDLPVLAGAAPELQASGWLNTEPLAPADLSGRVVLYEFWTFGCVNCRNVLPHVKAWHERYAGDGLVVLSVHTPEFDFEKDAAAVADFVAEQSIRYPVALDPDKRIWRAFENHYWPAFYLHDAAGRRRLVHIGEGGYDTTEDAIRALLGVAADAPRAEVAR